jgi:hypothetical protein
MVQPGRQERQPSVQPETPRLRPARYKALAAARGRVRRIARAKPLVRLKALDFADQAMLFGGGLLVNGVALSATDARLCDVSHNEHSIVPGHSLIERC